jgi:ABC-type amino acid transport substrate-binding protein
MLQRSFTLKRGIPQRWAAAGLGLLCIVVACPLHAGDLADIKARGKLVLVCFPNQDIPFVQVDVDAMRQRKLKLGEMRDPEMFMGLDVDVMKGFAKSLGVALEIRPFTKSFGELIPAMLHHKGDLIADSLTITPQRREIVDFSQPYFEGTVAVVTRAGSNVSSPADLAGKKCSAGSGTSQLEAMKTIVSKDQIALVDFPFQAYIEVEEKRADCAVAETGVAAGQRLKPPYPALQVAFVLSRYQYAVAVRKGSDLLSPLNAYLDGLKRSGELQRLADVYGLGTLGGITPPSQPREGQD